MKKEDDEDEDMEPRPRVKTNEDTDGESDDDAPTKSKRDEAEDLVRKVRFNLESHDLSSTSFSCPLSNSLHSKSLSFLGFRPTIPTWPSFFNAQPRNDLALPERNLKVKSLTFVFDPVARLFGLLHYPNAIACFNLHASINNQLVGG